MSLSLYEISIPTFTKFLNTVSELLKKGEQYADEQGIPHSKFMEARLAPDMQPFPFQIQATSLFARLVATKLGGVEQEEFGWIAPSFAELHERVQKTLEVLQKVDEAKLNGSGESPVTVSNPFGEFSFDGKTFILSYCLPNFYFHVTTTFAILRHLEVPLGKADFFNMKLSPKPDWQNKK